MYLTPKDAELIIGIVAPIGVDTKAITQSVKKELAQYLYDVYEIHVTDLMRGFRSKFDLVEAPTDTRYLSYISACNRLRSDIGNEVMATLAISEISNIRKKKDPIQHVDVRTAFIVNQIKRPEEFELLRNVYGEHYIQISCHADEEIRIDRLTKKIATDHPENPKNPQWDISARILVNKDESEEDEAQGQRVRKVFPLSDVILNARSRDSADLDVERFFRVLFGDNSVTPKEEEYGMELANTASQRSSDLSRQVGAAILTKTMEIRALGCNEVPKANGGTYWEGNLHDARDFTKGEDLNHGRRQAVLLDLMIRLKQAEALRPNLVDTGSIKAFLFDRKDNIISDSQILDSLEYGRTVHAEMNAITDAARTGNAVKDCQLFSNTFPCHNCAKHIVASGISEVIYIHPYPKSYAKELFDDSIAINPSGKVENRVVFRQFIGIVGPMYSRVFTKARWSRENGKIEGFQKNSASFIRRTPIPSYLETEKHLLHDLNVKLTKSGYF